MKSVSDIVAVYNDAIRQDADRAEYWLKHIYEEGEKRGVKYACKVIPTSLRPQFLDRAQENLVDRSVPLANACLERIINVWSNDPQARRIVRFEPEEEKYFSIPSGLTHNITVARHDAFLEGMDLQYIEFNTDSPASMGYMSQQREIYWDLPMMKAVREKFDIVAQHPVEMLYRALLNAFKDFGLNEEPRLIITDWKGVNTESEFYILKRYFEPRGLKTVVADPRELEFRDGKVHAGDFAANFVYRRVIWRELLAKIDECQGLVEASKSDTVCVANPFKSKIAGNKACLAMMIHPRYRDFFPAEERDFIENHIPWTALLSHDKVEFDGVEQDPFDVASAHKDKLVVKPLNDYGGRGVVIGPEASEAEWSAVLQKAKDEIGAWCTQTLVSIPVEEFPVFKPELRFEMRNVNLNPYALGGVNGGSLSRISASSIINVSAGGGLIPTFIIDGRK